VKKKKTGEPGTGNVKKEKTGEPGMCSEKSEANGASGKSEYARGRERGVRSRRWAAGSGME
jgi:hypothetical protein